MIGCDLHAGLQGHWRLICVLVKDPFALPKMSHIEKMMGFHRQQELNRRARFRNRAGVIEAIKPDMERSIKPDIVAGDWPRGGR